MIYIVIVNYRTADLVMQCLDSIFAQKKTFNTFKVIIIDNFSEDSSDIKLQNFVKSRDWVSWVDIISMPKNGGFAYGCNAGIRQAFTQTDAAKYIMLLNPDTLVREGAIEALATFLDVNPEVGIVGSQLENLDGGIVSSAHQFHSPISELLESARLGVLTRLLPKYEITTDTLHLAHQCDWVSGSSMMIRRQLFDDIGLLDEAYFLYFEEVDFFYRTAKVGWQTWYVPTSKVMHIEGAATGIKLIRRRPKYWYNSRRRYFVKHYGVNGLVFADLLWFVGRLSFLIRRFLKLGAQKTYQDPKWLMLDLLYGDFLAILTGRVWRLEKEKTK